MNQHAIGPWVIGMPTEKGYPILSKNLHHIATVEYDSLVVKVGYNNAKLIAAAPELYDILSQLLAIETYEQDHDEDCSYPTTNCWCGTGKRDEVHQKANNLLEKLNS